MRTTALACGMAMVWCAACLAADPWKFEASAALRETYDSNVFLQDEGPLAERDSMVTTASGSVGATWRPGESDAAKFVMRYQPSFTWFHSEPDENFAKHVGTIDFLGKQQNLSYQWLNTVTLVDGDDVSRVYSAPGAVPAIGGTPVRDRRDATVYRHSGNVTWREGAWLVRPQFAVYFHDFQTKHSSVPGYCNWVDRNDLSAGVDVGYEVVDKMHVVLGYRFGHQTQYKLLQNPIEYSNYYHRVLVGVEGSPAPWLKLAVMLGPDFRDYTGVTAPGFDEQRTKLFIDATVTVTPTPEDTLVLVVKAFELPGAGGCSVYEDITFQLSYTRKIIDALSVTLMGKANTGNWEPPVNREDWIYTAGVTLSYRIDEHFTASVGYELNRGESDVPNTKGREYTQHQGWAEIKWTW